MSDDAPYTDVQVQHILRNWREALDTCQDDPSLFTFDVRNHDCNLADCGESFVLVTRDLSADQLYRVHRYLTVLTSRYPFQLRKAFALARYHAFLFKWQDTGSFIKAMRAI